MIEMFVPLIPGFKSTICMGACLGDLDVVKYFIERGANVKDIYSLFIPTDKDGEAVNLKSLGDEYCAQLLEYLIKNREGKFDINDKDHIGNTALVTCLYHDLIECIDVLIKYGIDVESL